MKAECGWGGGLCVYQISRYSCKYETCSVHYRMGMCFKLMQNARERISLIPPRRRRSDFEPCQRKTRQSLQAPELTTAAQQFPASGKNGHIVPWKTGGQHKKAQLSARRVVTGVSSPQQGLPHALNIDP